MRMRLIVYMCTVNSACTTLASLHVGISGGCYYVELEILLVTHRKLLKEALLMTEHLLRQKSERTVQ